MSVTGEERLQSGDLMLSRRKVVKSVTLSPSAELHLEVRVSHTQMKEKDTFDMAAVRVRILDENDNTASYALLPIHFSIEGDAALVGPDTAVAEGGMTGTYIRTIGREGKAKLIVNAAGMESAVLEFNIEKEDKVWN